MDVTVVAGDRPDVDLLKLSGELDLATATRFEEAIAGLLAAGRIRFQVDLSALSFCDSVGLNALVRAKNHCRERGGWLRVSGPQGQVARVISISGLLDALAADD